MNFKLSLIYRYCLLSSGNLFHSLGPATKYALSPYAFRLAADSSSNLLCEDLNARPEFLYLSRSLMWLGASPF